jgi:hypothetical protein
MPSDQFVLEGRQWLRRITTLLEHSLSPGD